jgi:hypothetical protein
MRLQSCAWKTSHVTHFSRHYCFSDRRRQLHQHAARCSFLLFYNVVYTYVTTSKIEIRQIARLFGQVGLRYPVIGAGEMNMRCTFSLFQHSQLSIFVQRSLKRIVSDNLRNGTIQGYIRCFMEQIVAIVRGAPGIGLQIGPHRGRNDTLDSWDTFKDITRKMSEMILCAKTNATYM